MKDLEEGNQGIVEVYYEHLLTTSERCADALLMYWNDGEPNQGFEFLLEQADQGDLETIKKKCGGKHYLQLRQGIDKGPEPIPPAGSRHLCVIEGTVLEVLALISDAFNERGADSIISADILGEMEKTKESEWGGASNGCRAVRGLHGLSNDDPVHTLTNLTDYMATEAKRIK